MAEYIDRDAVYHAISVDGGLNAYEKVYCIDIVRKIPAADVAPVRHGRWIWADDGYCRCSECKQKATVIRQWDDEPMTTMTNCCPVCGARMDGGGCRETD